MLLGNIIVGIGAAAAFTTMALIEGLYFKERRSARKMMGYLCVIILGLLVGFAFRFSFITLDKALLMAVLSIAWIAIYKLSNDSANSPYSKERKEKTT